MSSPLNDDRNARLAAALSVEHGGHPLAVYASVRSTSRVPDALVGLGLPLIDYVFGTLDDTPARVTAVRGQHSAHNPLLGLGTDVEMWTVLIRCGSGMTVTVDVAMGPWATAVGPLELRVEWMRPERSTTFHPKSGSIVSGEPGDASLGLTGLEERLLNYAVDLCDLVVEGETPAELDVAMRIVEAARASAAQGTPVDLSE